MQVMADIGCSAEFIQAIQIAAFGNEECTRILIRISSEETERMIAETCSGEEHKRYFVAAKMAVQRLRQT